MPKDDPRERFDYLKSLGYGVCRVHRRESKAVIVLRGDNAVRIVRTSDEDLILRACEGVCDIAEELQRAVY